jgi:tRNA-2-methylthio-N6-dimethylallyladenosine synthase
MSGQFVPEPVIRERFGRLAEVQGRISEERNIDLVGSSLEVLSEGPSRKAPGVATTRTRTGKVVHVEGEYPGGSFLQVEIETAYPHHLVGRPV